jgi:eukaryotic-like serine/threonine-protein kinase
MMGIIGRRATPLGTPVIREFLIAAKYAPERPMEDQHPKPGDGDETTDGPKPATGGAADLPTEPAGDPLPAQVEAWAARLPKREQEAGVSFGIDDPLLLEDLRQRIEAQKQRQPADGPDDDLTPGVDVTDGGMPAAQTQALVAPVTQGPKLGPAKPAPAGNSAFIGRYEVRKILGQGGYGRVYLAYDSELDRLVAIKIPLADRASELVDVQSYLDEARVLARLSHPNIVPVYDVGRTRDGSCYVVSRYIDGGDLASRLALSRYSIDEATALIAALAEALHYTHTHDLFHRDIKPANILIDSDGIPCLADFGLALKDENHGHGAGFVGTAAYMSPEQARGEGHLVDGRSDIFSLAIVFYELLVGRRPFRGKSREEVMHKIITEEPRPPRQIDDKLPRELERICMKALSKRAAERYSTAKDMADDLRHFLQSRTASARSETATDLQTMTNGLASGDRMASQSTNSLLVRSDSITIVPRGLSSFDEHDADFFLELLPGPRDRNGLPDGLRFWKARTEATDPDKTFRVGIIYGPSGCGKSSLIKAGLLPLLERDQGVTSVYVEASATETEARLLRGIKKAIGGLDEESGLVATLTAIRRGRSLPSGGKLLLVVDQLEQWLFARLGEQGTELVDALRQCDGEHLQAICLVRDDFWMATTRFMRDLEIDLVPDRNIAAVDLFDAKHARKVLAAYGRAYGAISAVDGDLPREQSTFLDQAVAGLIQDGTVVPVRLALFAEMVKRKTWTPATLREVGGPDGVGVKFLEETFSSARSSPKHRYHQAAAQAVLKSLLPETNADIKGRMRSIDDLREVSGYGDRAGDFSELIRVLDNDLRLITPVDREGAIEPHQPTTPAPDSRNYQLTHDYLVHSLRDWLTRKQRETRRGRAEALLAERAALWSNQPERRYLPSITEWASIRLLTHRREWTRPQQTMMRHTDRLIALKAGVIGVLFAGLYLGGLAINRRVIEVRNDTHATGLVQQLVKADIAQVPAIVQEINHFRRWADPALGRIAAESAPGSKQKLHASIALLPVREDQLAYLHESLAAADPATTLVLKGALRPYRAKLIDGLWSDLRAAGADDRRILPTASLLADYDSANRAWGDVGAKLAEVMVKVKLDDVKGWLEALWNARAALVDPLAKIYREKGRPEIDHTVASTLLARYTDDELTFAVDLLLDADPGSFPILFPVIRDNKDLAVPILSAALSTTTGDPTRARSKSALAPVTVDENLGGASLEAQDLLAARRARAAVALVWLGHGEKVWSLLVFGPDPTTRSTLINAFHTYQVPPADLVQELERLVKSSRPGGPTNDNQPVKNAYLFDPVVSEIRGLIQALAAYPPRVLPSDGQAALCNVILDLHRNDSDAGVHSAAELFLSRWGRAGSVVVDARVPAALVAGQHRWYINPAGHTMVLIDGPVEFQMGSPPSDPEREDGDVYHRCRIPRAFAISTKEVTIREYEVFAKETRRPMPQYGRRYSPDKGGPQMKVSWFDAAAYCNWLSRKEGLSPCYEANDIGGGSSGLKINIAAVAAGAYRLPTEAEWEYACRAGTTSCRYFGHTPALLRDYEWYVETSGDHAHVCGMLLPNDLGLFDTLGNVAEWCHDGYRDPERSFASVVDDTIIPEVVSQGDRHQRGQTYHDTLTTVRAGTRTWMTFSEPRNDIGFRPARTIPAPAR